MNQVYRKGLFIRTDKSNIYKKVCKICGTEFVFDGEGMYKHAHTNGNGVLGRVLCPNCHYRNVVEIKDSYKG